MLSVLWSGIKVTFRRKYKAAVISSQPQIGKNCQIRFPQNNKQIPLLLQLISTSLPICSVIPLLQVY